MTWAKRIAIGCVAAGLLAGCGSAAHHSSAASTTPTTKAAHAAKKAVKKKAVTKLVKSTPSTTTRHATTTTSPPTTAAATTTTAAPAKALPPISFENLPVPSGYTCAGGLDLLAPANQASSFCLPYSFLVGGTASDPNDHTSCPAGSTQTMGPVLCENSTGIVTPVAPGASLPDSTLAWSGVQFPTGTCPSGYYSGDTNGTATCVPSGYLLGGSSSGSEDDNACPSGSALRIAKLTGTLCTEESSPYDIVAPVPSS